MLQIGPAVPLYETVLLWVGRTVILALICSFFAWLGIRALDALTPRIQERERIGEDPVSVGLFIAGFFIFIGLVIHGTVSGPLMVGGPLIESLIDPIRLGMVAISFFVSFLLGLALFHLVDWLTPRIPFRSVNQKPLAVGVYVFGYLVFFGLIVHAALTTSLPW